MYVCTVLYAGAKGVSGHTVCQLLSFPIAASQGRRGVHGASHQHVAVREHALDPKYESWYVQRVDKIRSMHDVVRVLESRHSGKIYPAALPFFSIRVISYLG